MRRSIRLGLLLAGALGASVTLAAGQSQDLRLEAAIEPAVVYLQAQAVYRLRFYQAVDVRNLKIDGPSTRLADLRQIGTERVYEALRDGRRYRVHERRYAVFPFSSGALELAGAHAIGRVAAMPAVAEKSSDGRREARLEAAPQTLTVRPVPASAGAIAWLPAHWLTLTESWSPPADETRPGQAQRRNIRIEAAGVDAGQIAPVEVSAPGMMVDAEPPRLENRMVGELNIGMREQTFRMVALHAGEVLVPELKLGWWNVNTDALASAVLPSRTLHVAAAATDTAPSGIVAQAAAPITIRPAPTWLQLLLAAGITLAAGVAFAYARRLKVRATWRLRRACHLGDVGVVRDSLLQWAALIWPQDPPLSLGALAERLPDPAARRAFGIIERSLYGPDSDSCGKATLIKAVGVIKHGRR